MARKKSTASETIKKAVSRKVTVILRTATVEGSTGDTVTLEADYANRLIAKGLAEKAV
jgi:hypothetical protein